ncbi:MAG: hypothetical protein ABIQ01_09050 [Pseudolysinimonas sp.]
MAGNVLQTAPTAGAVVALLLLSACSGGGVDDGAADPAEEAPAASAVDTGCLTRTWDLDLPDLASQMAIELASDGLEVIEYAGVGRHSITFADSGEASMSVDATFSLTVTSGAGPQITVVQIHTGEPFGQWGWVGDSNVLEFDDWNNGGYEVQNITAINGVNTEEPIALPSDTLGEANMEVVCDGSTMTTHTLGSPYTHRWSPA